MLQLAVLVNDPKKSWLSKLVNIFTRSHASHVELVFSDGVATIVTPSTIALAKRASGYDKYHWVLVPLPHIYEAQEYIIRYNANLLYAKRFKYDYLGAISGLFGSARQNKDKWYCGEIVAELLKDYIPELGELDWATPDKVWKIVAENA